MEANLLLEQYSRYKKAELEASPYRCLLNADIELNPHQINAFCAALHALPSGGIILADEVGLGKTIEAGLVIDYLLNSGIRKILIALPATLRMQWKIELEDKFGINSVILDRLTVKKDRYKIQKWVESRKESSIVLTSYDYSSKFMKRFPNVKWDLIIIDEAHNLRNVFHNTKRAWNLYTISQGIPKLLLTATPLQNSLSDLHGLVSFIDPRIFGSEKVFNRRFVEGGDYEELKKELQPVLYRTLRRDVGKYLTFSRRICKTVNFSLSEPEKRLYDQVNDFLRRDNLYSLPNANGGLILLVIRKLLASSSFAVIETFEILRDRLDKLYQGTKSEDAQDGFELFWEFVEDEIDDDAFEEHDDEERIIQKQEILDEKQAVQDIIGTASSIHENSKVIALKEALGAAFQSQKEEGIPQKAVVFTESKRTQRYIADELREDGYQEEDILLFNGDFNDAMTKTIYRSWKVKNFGKPDYGRNVEYKHAIVDYFRDHAKVLIVTDAGSEGLNLQYCSTVINYDLPWNPQKIEQRIGRCHRYGQTHDVVAINFLNTENEADKRVYELLSRKFSLFEGVFGASDVALGALESGAGFEKTVLNIYQSCQSDAEYDQAFDLLTRRLDRDIDSKAGSLRSILLTESPQAKEHALDQTKSEIDKYLREVEYWSKVAEPEIDQGTYFWKIDNWGEKIFGSHGTMFLGAFCNAGKQLFPVLLLCDENGDYVDFNEDDIVPALEQADDEDIHYFKPTQEEMSFYRKIYDQLLGEMTDRYEQSVAADKEYNRHKQENWVSIQIEQDNIRRQELQADIEKLLEQESAARDSLEKSDILKKAVKKKKSLDKLNNESAERTDGYYQNAKQDIEMFNRSCEITPALSVNIVLKY